MNTYAIIITHFVSDWILQPRDVAEKKTSSPFWMFWHISVVFFCFLGAVGGTYLFGRIPGELILACVWNAIAHFFIDASMWGFFRAHVAAQPAEYIKYNLYAKDKWFYITIGIDQTLHLCVLFYLFQ